jgi:hypothetical protein
MLKVYRNNIEPSTLNLERFGMAPPGESHFFDSRFHYLFPASGFSTPAAPVSGGYSLFLLLALASPPPSPLREGDIRFPIQVLASPPLEMLILC